MEMQQCNPAVCIWNVDIARKWCESHWVSSHEVSTKNYGNHVTRLGLCRDTEVSSCTGIYHLTQGYRITVLHIRPCWVKSSCQSVDLLIQQGNVSVPSGPISFARSPWQQQLLRQAIGRRHSRARRYRPRRHDIFFSFIFIIVYI